MPKSTNILMVRHAEKPTSGVGLAVAGQERAQAYIVYFQNYQLDAQPVKLNFLFAAANSNESHRPYLTIHPLARALGIKPNTKHKDACYQEVADDILQNSKYDESNILICWHHGQILQLATALGAQRSKLPPQSHWPKKPWPAKVFGWVLQLRYDGNGDLIPAQTICINEKLMHDDYDKHPPLHHPTAIRRVTK